MLRWPRCNGKEERVKKGCVSVRCWSILSKAPCVSWEEVLSQHSLPSQWRSAVSHNSRCFTLYATAGSKKKASKSGDAAVAAAGPTPLELSLRLEVILSSGPCALNSAAVVIVVNLHVTLHAHCRWDFACVPQLSRARSVGLIWRICCLHTCTHSSSFRLSWNS